MDDSKRKSFPISTFFSRIVQLFKTNHLVLQSSLEEWRFVFWITFGIFVVTTVVYSIWASGEVQPWNFPKECRSSELGNNENNNTSEKQLERGDNKL